MKVEPLQDEVPRSLMPDAEAEAYFTRLHRWVRDMWLRTGGGSDAIEDNQVQALRHPTPVTTIDRLDNFHIGKGAPASTKGKNNDFYFRLDGASGTVLYHKESGSWVAIT